MYYKEEIINGVLCWRHMPDGEWIPMDPKAMTARIQRLEKELKYFQERFKFVVAPEENTCVNVERSDWTCPIR